MAKKHRFNIIKAVGHLDTSISNKVLGKKATSKINSQVHKLNIPKPKRNNIFSIFF